MNKPLLYQAAMQNIYGKQEQFTRGSITDALFVYLDGEPEPESIARVESHFRNRPLVCMTGAWEEQIKAQYPDAAVYWRTMMNPACRFTIPEKTELPKGYFLTGMDKVSFINYILSETSKISSFRMDYICIFEKKHINLQKQILTVYARHPNYWPRI